MRAKIRALQNQARPLEPDAAERANLLAGVGQYAESFLENLAQAPAYAILADGGRGLYDSPITDEPIELDTALNLLQHNVDQVGINPASPGAFGYIPGGGLYFAALGDYLAAVTNRYAGLFFASPGAVRMEQMLLAWLAGEVGYPANAAGTLTSGGSIANLAGIVTAREVHDLKAKDFDRSVVYLSRQTHHSVDKALRLAGLRECVKRYIPLDRQYRMRAEVLAETILSDKKAGLHPWLIIASAGTTDVGAVDPLPDIADIAHTHQLWLHTDGAYGGIFTLCAEGKEVLPGLEKADSLVIDPHKGLFLPYGTGAILVKNGQQLHQAHYYQDAPYMQDAETAPAEIISPADLSPELTRHFRGLRLWLALKLAGVAPFRAVLAEKILLARYFHEQVQTLTGFEVGPYPDLSIATYRYLPPRGNANVFNQKLAQAVQNDGRVFVSSTMLDGKFILRLAVLCFRSHLDEVDRVLEVLQEKVEELKK
ncbi:MAG: amino acid decarboxylase [Anaerolineae bacterium]|nr:amino acid decarboxylase [Anaerolineae bacterium]